MSKVVVADFDGTITLKDSFFQSIFFYNRGFQIWFKLPKAFLVVFLHIIGIIDRNEAKEKIVKLFYKGKSLNQLKSDSSELIKKFLYNNKTITLLENYRRQGYQLYIVSASLNFYIEEIANENNYSGFICSEVEIDSGGILTGRIIGGNCNYDEKVNRIRKSGILDNATHIVAFGNSKGDFAMFKMADEYYYVKKNNIYKNRVS